MARNAWHTLKFSGGMAIGKDKKGEIVVYDATPSYAKRDETPRMGNSPILNNYVGKKFSTKQLRRMKLEKGGRVTRKQLLAIFESRK